MARSITASKGFRGHPASYMRDLIVQFNKLADDQVAYFNYKVENLGAGADITERGFFQAQDALTIKDVRVIPEAASSGVDGSNTIVVTLRNITEGVNIATVESSTDWVANTPVELAITAANADVAADDVLGVVVTNGAAADPGTFVLQFSYAQETAKKIGPDATTAHTS